MSFLVDWQGQIEINTDSNERNNLCVVKLSNFGKIIDILFA
jgi:hypothetical protein